MQKDGRIALRSTIDGLLGVDIEPLAAFNTIDEVMCTTLHDRTPVKEEDWSLLPDLSGSS